jgi:hypothetical protein
MALIYTMDNCAQCAADKQAGQRLEVDAELFDWFLEVLPPVHMGYTATVGDGSTVRALFGFAEGLELVTAFWRQDGHYYAQLTTEMNPYV